MRSILVLLSLLCATTSALALSLPPPAPPPLGWETRQTPGFEPSIEYVVAIESDATEQQLRQYVENWGPDALPVLRKLYEEEAWAAYRGRIQQIIGYFREELPWPMLRKRFAELAPIEKPSDEQANELWQIARDLGKRDNAEALDLLESALAKASERQSHALIAAIVQRASVQRLSALQNAHDAAQDSNTRSNLAHYIEEMTAQLRALEPMSRILEAEAAQ